MFKKRVGRKQKDTMSLFMYIKTYVDTNVSFKQDDYYWTTYHKLLIDNKQYFQWYQDDYGVAFVLTYGTQNYIQEWAQYKKGYVFVENGIIKWLPEKEFKKKYKYFK